MKKIIAVALLVLLLFNTGGYQLLFQYLIYESESAVNNQINSNSYKPADLQLVKIPVHLSIVNWDDFKPISGEFRTNNNCYHYAQLKMTCDTIYMMCLRNNDRARLQNAGRAYAKDVSDAPQNKRSHDPLGKKGISLSEYNCQFFSYTYTAHGTFLKQTSWFVISYSANPFIESPGKPPDTAC